MPVTRTIVCLTAMLAMLTDTLTHLLAHCQTLIQTPTSLGEDRQGPVCHFLSCKSLCAALRLCRLLPAPPSVTSAAPRTLHQIGPSRLSLHTRTHLTDPTAPHTPPRTASQKTRPRYLILPMPSPPFHMARPSNPSIPYHTPSSRARMLTPATPTTSLCSC